VVGVLASAVGEWGARVVLVVEGDWRYRNAARERLQSKGYMTCTAGDGFDALQRLEEAPIKDAIIIAGDLTPWLKDDKGRLIDLPQQAGVSFALSLLGDPRVGKTPVFVALPEDPIKAAEVQKALDGKVAGFVKKPYAAVDLDSQIQAALDKVEVPNINRQATEEVALRACVALQQPDPARTQFDLGLAAESLAKTLDARSDAVRIEALKALGNAAQGRSGDRVRALVGRLTDVYAAQDGEMKPALRAAFLRAIGLLDPSTAPAQQIIAKALAHEDAQVRAAAADALGHAPRIAPELLARLQAAQRLDVRSISKPAAPAAPAAQ
jgi:CheY-like chemotaxis protein